MATTKKKRPTQQVNQPNAYLPYSDDFETKIYRRIALVVIALSLITFFRYHLNKPEIKVIKSEIISNGGPLIGCQFEIKNKNVNDDSFRLEFEVYNDSGEILARESHYYQMLPDKKYFIQLEEPIPLGSAKIRNCNEFEKFRYKIKCQNHGVPSSLFVSEIECASGFFSCLK